MRLSFATAKQPEVQENGDHHLYNLVRLLERVHAICNANTLKQQHPGLDYTLASIVEFTEASVTSLRRHKDLEGVCYTPHNVTEDLTRAEEAELVTWRPTDRR